MEKQQQKCKNVIRLQRLYVPGCKNGFNGKIHLLREVTSFVTTNPQKYVGRNTLAVSGCFFQHLTFN